MSNIRYVDKVKFNCYDKGAVTPLQIGYKLAAEELRDIPQIMTKKDMGSWHKPKRVDVVLYDKEFEELVNPPEVMDELDSMIKEFKINYMKGK